MNFLQFMQSKSQWSTHLVVFFNPLLLVVTKEHKYLNLEVLVEGLPKYVWPFVNTRHWMIKKCYGNF